MTQLKSNKYLDYNTEFETTEDRAHAHKLTERGKAADLKISKGILEYGEVLHEGREFMPHGTFMRWIEAEFGFSYNVARRLINVFERVKVSDLGNFGLSRSVLFILTETNVDDDTLECGLDLIKSGDLKTTGDAKQLVEAAKPITPLPVPQKATPPTYPDSVLDDDDFDDSDPFEDEPALKSVPATPENLPDAEPLPTVPTPSRRELPSGIEDTLTPVQAKRAQDARIEADSAVDESTLDDSQWLQTLPIYRVLSTQTGGKGILLKRSLLDYRRIEKTLIPFQKQVHQSDAEKLNGTSPFDRAIKTVLGIKSPRYWGICAPCKGGGCARCGNAGFDITSGIDPARVESGEFEL